MFRMGKMEQFSSGRSLKEKTQIGQGIQFKPRSMRMSIEEQLDGSLGPPELDILRNATGAVATVVSRLFQDLTTNRPIIATINMCPGNLKDATPDRVTALMMHELLHGLGFSSSLFGAFINPDTLEPKGENAVRSVLEVDGKEVLMVISETVKREARTQFNCQELEGALFEDEGGVGSANAHWEFTHFQGDLMLASTRSSVAGEPPRISRITMALMEDTGWYLGNWSAVGGLLQYAQGSGCTLPQRGCAAMMQEEKQQKQSLSVPQQSSGSSLFCSPSQVVESNGKRCAASHRAIGQCETGIQFANGCGMAVASDGLPTCTLPNRMYPNPMVFGWKNAPSSRCFDIGLHFTAKDSGSSPQSDSPSMLTFPEGGSKGSSSAACFPSTCHNGQHFVVILGQEFRCQAGEVLDLAQLMPDVYSEGYIGPCPEEAQMCQTHCPSCSPLGGVCHEGKCNCKLGFEGEACEHNLMGLVPLGDVPADDFVVGRWYETLEVTLGLESSGSGQPLEERGQMLVRAFASWSNLPPKRLKLASARLTRSAADTAHRSKQRSSSTRTDVSLQGDAGIAGAVRESLGHIGGRRLHQHARRSFPPGIHQGSLRQPSPEQGSTEPNGVGEPGRQRGLKRRRVTAVEGKAAAGENKVVFHIHPSSKELADLSAMLVSDDNLQLLSQALEEKGFQLKEGSVSQRLALLREKAVELEESGNGDPKGGMDSLDQIEVRA
ncbi:hypothetical protein DUNSADRAFT_5931 [Dunaliella salina]|uniref:Leishmanolysin-like peptidase n=1 Tax=Dunaliella salina TaxID=3046 RepID=A0ABQ7GPA9_DUNSA|nr:hypothetical protein DUNSADRAFT_5931 [Dunaliella salina]|eukprot:KAF5836425.1 hypothetical protein DUNSADRAFT_5931 [Dunaliella salina]